MVSKSKSGSLGEICLRKSIEMNKMSKNLNNIYLMKLINTAFKRKFSLHFEKKESLKSKTIYNDNKKNNYLPQEVK